MKLSIVKCKSGSAEDLINGISTILDDFNAWSCTIIICDTIAVSTGHINGVVTRIKRKYVGCQNYVLDRILKHVLGFYFKEHTVGPNINYSFIEEVIENYGNFTILFYYVYIMQDFKFIFISCTAF